MTDINDEYRELLQRATDLRRRAQEQGLRDVAMFAKGSFVRDLCRYDDDFDDHLVVFAANDFGIPVALRPSAVSIDAQNEVRERIHDQKYRRNAELNRIREALLDEYPRVHKVLPVTYGSSIDYHLPEATSPHTNFTSIRDALGLVDWTTNGSYRNCNTYD